MSVLLRQAGGFEGLRLVAVAGCVGHLAVAESKHLGDVLVHADPGLRAAMLLGRYRHAMVAGRE